MGQEKLPKVNVKASINKQKVITALKEMNVPVVEGKVRKSDIKKVFAAEEHGRYSMYHAMKRREREEQWLDPKPAVNKAIADALNKLDDELHKTAGLANSHSGFVKSRSSLVGMLNAMGAALGAVARGEQPELEMKIAYEHSRSI